MAEMPLAAENYTLPDDSLILRGIHEMYNYDRTEAKTLFSQVVEDYPNHPVGYLLTGVADWMLVRGTGGIPASEETLIHHMDITIGVAEKYTTKHQEDPYGWLLYGMAQGIKARVDLARSHWFDAVIHGYRGITKVKRAQQLAPDLPEVKLAMGAFHYYVGMSSTFIQAAARLLGLHGTTAQGKAELEYAMSHARYSTPEVKSILLYINGYLEDHTAAALSYAASLTKNYPDSPYYWTLRADMEFAQHDTSAAIQSTRKVEGLLPRINRYYQVEFRHKIVYLQGQLQYYREHYSAAINLLNTYIAEDIGEYDLHSVNAQLIIAKSYQKSGFTTKARDTFAQVANTPIPTRMQAEAKVRLQEISRKP